MNIVCEYCRKSNTNTSGFCNDCLADCPCKCGLSNLGVNRITDKISNTSVKKYLYKLITYRNDYIMQMLLKHWPEYKEYAEKLIMLK